MKPNVVSPPGDLLHTGPLLNRREAAELLAVSPTTVWRLVRSGELRAYKVGGQIRLTAVDCENYVKQQPPPLPEEED